jgi:hypothetical protein
MLRTNPRVDDQERQGAGSVPGETFAGRWRAVSEIGRGSTGHLYLASDDQSGERASSSAPSTPACCATRQTC